MNTVQSCSYNSPISVAHIQLEIVGNPKVRVFTIVTVIKEKHAMLLPYKVKGKCELYT